VKRHMISAALIALTIFFGEGTASSQERSGDLEIFRHRSRYTGWMDGFEENPSVVTTGWGRLRLRIDDRAQIIRFELSYDDLEGGAVSASHIHVAAKHVNGGVSAFFCGGGGKPACPMMQPAMITGMIVPSDVIGPAGQGIDPGEFDELVRAIRAGYTYANVHTTRWPGGEIRGQIK
jgi:hypothetical protein